MLDTAMPDITDDGLINFEKHRKEFEVLAQLRLLQSAAQIYNIQYDNRFWEWFDSIRIYSDTERLVQRRRDKSASLQCFYLGFTAGIKKVSTQIYRNKKYSCTLHDYFSYTFF